MGPERAPQRSNKPLAQEKAYAAQHSGWRGVYGDGAHPLRHRPALQRPPLPRDEVAPALRREPREVQTRHPGRPLTSPISAQRPRPAISRFLHTIVHCAIVLSVRAGDAGIQDEMAGTGLPGTSGLRTQACSKPSRAPNKV